jgi:hypothetical protein
MTIRESVASMQARAALRAAIGSVEIAVSRDRGAALRGRIEFTRRVLAARVSVYSSERVTPAPSRGSCAH